MTTKQPKTRPARTAEQLADAARVKALYEAVKRKRKINQDDVAAHLEINQSAVSQYMNGHIVLNVETVIGFATFFGVDFSEISPTIAERVRKLGIKRPGDRYGSSRRPPMERIEQAFSDLMILGVTRARLIAAITEAAEEASQLHSAMVEHFKATGKSGYALPKDTIPPTVPLLPPPVHRKKDDA